MKLSATTATKQRGAALFALLIFILLAGSYGVMRSSNFGYGQSAESEKLQLRLARAKEALIAYAITDPTRPGRLPCPDTQGSGTAALLTRDDCDSYRGGLPWKTLDLMDAEDGFNRKLQYALSPLYGGDRSSPPLNSETATALGLDIPVGSTSNDIVALIIAGRGALDARNADEDNYFFRGTAALADSSLPADNDDEIIAITRQELMAAVELRIANQLRTCLAEHAASADNLQQTYPWPAPLSNTSYLGATKSLFGMVPMTQPGNPEMTLKAVNAQLLNLKIGLNSASTATDRIRVLRQVQEQAAYASALFDQLHRSASDLNARAISARAAFNTLDATLVSATADKDTYSTSAASLPAAFASALPSLSGLLVGLENSGFDLFINELQSQNQLLRTRIDQISDAPTTSGSGFNALITPVNALKNGLLDNSLSSNPDLETLIKGAHDAAIAAATAVNLARKSLAPPNPENAIAAANALHAADGQLALAILNTRVNIDPAELSARIASIDTALIRLASGGSLDLARNLNSTSGLLVTLVPSTPSINAAKQNAISAIDSASSVLAGNDQGAIQSRTQAAMDAIRSLKSLIELTGDNIAKEMLTAVSAALTGFQTSAPATVTAARQSRTSVNAVLYWADRAIEQTPDIARLSRRGLNALEDSDSSAYVAASRLLASLDGSTGSIALLEKLATDQSAEAAQKAQDAYTESLTGLESLTQTTTALDDIVQTSLAKAGSPTVWYGKSCAFLMPASGSKKTWWEANDWRRLFFYQIADRVRPNIGSLTVNGQGNHPALAIAAGAELATQKNLRANNRRVANYLERATNADPSRDGDAQNPSRQFVSEGLSATFNDRLAH